MKPSDLPAPFLLRLALVTLWLLSSCGNIEAPVVTRTLETHSPPLRTASATPTLPQPSDTPTATQPSTEAPVPTSTTEPPIPAPRTIACPEYLCVWILEAETPRFQDFGNQVELAYDYAPATRRILHGRFTEQGAGPGNISVSDLWSLDLNTDQNQRILDEESVVEAIWAPNGEDIFYVQATESSYELHWRSAAGENRLLASQVAFTFSVSPQGDRVAFTRESGYETGGEPGLYVVNLETGEERLLSDADRAGFGSISDRPIWSPDGSQILVPIHREAAPMRWLRAAADGSDAGFLTYVPHLEQVLARKNWGTNVLWHPDRFHLIAQVFPDQLAGLPNQIFLFELDPPLEHLISGEVFYEGEGELLGWDQPGISIWIRTPENDLQSISLP